jgi:tRNA (mo5U34)-methyltransferase
VSGILGRLGMRRVSPELRQELDEGSTWTYEWRLGPGITTPVHRPFLPDLYGSCERMIEEPVREALTAAGPEASAIDIACNEGWFAQRILDWGARRVVAVDSRELNVRRARLLRDHFGIEAERLELIEGDLFDLDPTRVGQFDVVNLLGIIYHLENPMGAMRIARSLARSLCVVESQVADLDAAAARDGAEGGVAGFLVHREGAQTQISPLAAMPGILSLIPTPAAIVEMALAAGFAEAEVLEPPEAYRDLRRERAIVLARC